MENDNVVGFIKFIDNEYIDQYFSLSHLVLINIKSFTSNSFKEGDLINDIYEGKTLNLELVNNSFISCFTEIDQSSFDATGVLKEEIVNALLTSEKQSNNKREFVIIPKKNMDSLLSKFHFYKKEDALEKSDIFYRKVTYEDNYKEEALITEQKFISNKISIQCLGEKMLATKSSMFSIQNEFRIGYVLPLEYNRLLKPNETLKITLEPEIEFATKKHPSEYLKSLIIDDFK